MKPNFALSLSFEGIRLLHRAAGGWRVVGDVALDAGDMAAELAVLRRTAASLEPGGVRTKLLVPNDQIKYLTIDTEGLDDTAQREAARAALDGATPYAVDDLAFDISADGTQTHIAAVAHETLAEAEAFAAEHNFHPVSFVAIPGDQPYLGEPFFGPSAGAKDLLEADETVEPDGIAVVVIGDMIRPKAEAKVEQVAELELDLDPEPVAEPEPQAEPEPAPKAAETPKEPPQQSEKPALPPQTRAAPEVKVEEKPEPVSVPPVTTAAPDLPVETKTPDAPKPVPKSETETETVVAPKTPPGVATPTVAPPTAAVTATVPKAPAPAIDPPIAPSAPKPSAPQIPTLGAATRDVPPPKAAPASPPVADAPASVSGFASRRGTEKAAPLAGARREPTMSPVSSDPKPAGASVSDPSLPADLVEPVLVPDSSSLAPQITEAAPASKASFLSRRKGKSAAAAAKRTKPVKPVTPPGTEAERMTIFGARKIDVGGKPRFLGLILTAALLVFLAGVAAWASVFLDDGLNLSRIFGDRSPRTTASIPDTPAPETEDIRTASLEPGLSEVDTAVLDALRDPVAPPIVELTKEEAEAKYAATGIWPRAPDVPPEPAALIDIEDLYLTSIDPVSTSTDAVALPSPASLATDVAFGTVSSPAAAGTQFALDTRGLVIPTAQGALSPDGFTVYLGRPDVVPPATLARLPTPAEVTQESDALAAFRPKVRPGDLVETTERAQLDGLTRSELAGFRPLLRPKSVQQQAEAAAAPETPTVDTTDAVAAALAPAPAIENATRYAVKASMRPDTRPRNFARIVKRAQRSAPEQEATQVASVAPRVVTPKIPTKTSVARQATVKNAINLRKVNLIGVYGKPSKRRALVRLSNGRYKKVVVGDRIDGGRVSAIGDSELRYTKRGRNVVLKMPKG
ncbi:MAG: hypothetical protein WA790_16250 [Sulfitobacter sp.]